ncbi:hypothetical protein DGG96_01105 [Legionella qingyii]|uniref:Uncharacterized protein n=1 Tax=Legionella qingyii TaxID=2184757 RepID=A0A317U9G4_9GAMM|nr:hypothetical protein [Legionella qingyii]PWY57032.1 hypothetical protein DGG96_03320 [Legionella qingyii]PWY57347.1 hypothetical protein DGG96_01105 [Legionella qingyii]RUR26436.1 hypothetical protein ELY20_00510 [Legionella qingyii]RUR27456.1 hypothetical protein ELY16_04855 [Legionella qingyii]
MAFVKFFKDTAADLGEVVKQRPPIYTSVKKLINQLDYEAKEGKKTLPNDVLNAVQQLKAQLQSTLDKFDSDLEKGIRILAYKNRVKEMAEECRSAIYSWEPTLMAQTGAFNKLKAYINAFLEEYFGIESYFTIEKNELGLKQGMSSNWVNTKGALTEEVIQSPEDLPCGCILSC